MQHEDQHREAVKKSLSHTKFVRAMVYDDKVKELGRVEVKNGTITVVLTSTTSIVEEKHNAKFLADTIGIAIEECYLKMPEAFDPHSWY